jgi:hypothetical protein
MEAAIDSAPVTARAEEAAEKVFLLLSATSAPKGAIKIKPLPQR